MGPERVMLPMIGTPNCECCDGVYIKIQEKECYVGAFAHSEDIKDNNYTVIRNVIAYGIPTK